MRFFSKVIGLGLFLVGLYFLGQNIVFTTQVSPYWWRDIPATGSVISLMAGILTLMFGGRSRELGWMLIGLGILLVFLSGGVVLRPTSLWTFCLAFAAIVAGWKLIRTGRIGWI